MSFFFHPMFTKIDRCFNWLCLKRVNLCYLLAFVKSKYLDVGEQ